MLSNNQAVFDIFGLDLASFTSEDTEQSHNARAPDSDSRMVLDEITTRVKKIPDRTSHTRETEARSRISNISPTDDGFIDRLTCTSATSTESLLLSSLEVDLNHAGNEILDFPCVFLESGALESCGASSDEAD